MLSSVPGGGGGDGAAQCAAAEHAVPAVHAAPTTQGLVADPTLLDTSDVELVDVKFLEEEPILVVQVRSPALAQPNLA